MLAVITLAWSDIMIVFSHSSSGSGSQSSGGSSGSAGGGATGFGWSDRALAKEEDALTRLLQIVRICLLCSVVLATVGLVVVDQVVFSTGVMANMDRVDRVGIFSAYCARSLYFLRNLHQASVHSDRPAFDEASTQIIQDMQEMQANHVEIYNSLPPGKVKDFYLEKQVYITTMLRTKSDVRTHAVTLCLPG